MNQFLQSLLQSLLFAIGIPFSLFSVLKIVDDVFGSGDIGKKLADTFSSASFHSTPGKWCLSAFLVVDEIFGEKLISLRSFIISSSITIIWVIIQMIGSYFFYKNGIVIDSILKINIMLKKFLLLLSVCILIDYISVCITRLIFRKMILKYTTLSIITDLAVSVSLFYVLYNLFKYFLIIKGYQEFLPYLQDLHPEETILSWLSSPFEVHSQLIALNDIFAQPIGNGQYDLINGNFEVLYNFPEGMLFVSSLFTSVWVWAFSISLWLFNVLKRATSLKNFLVKESSIASKPYLSVGIITTILFFIPAFLFHFVWSLIVVFMNK